MLNTLKRILDRLALRKKTALPWYKLIWWWEARRILCNIILLPIGLVTIAILKESVLALEEHSEVINPFTTFWFVAIGINIFYACGWILELLLRAAKASDAEQMGRAVFKGGLVFAVAMTLLVPWLLTVIALIFH